MRPTETAKQHLARLVRIKAKRDDSVRAFVGDLTSTRDDDEALTENLRLGAIEGERVATLEELSNLDLVANRHPQLTLTELKVLSLIAEGETELSAAEILGISKHTVRDHLKVARKRLGGRTTAHAVAIALRSGQLV